MGISCFFPSLMVLHFIFDASSCSFSKAFSLPYSEMVDIKEANAIAITMPIVSYQSKLEKRNTVLIAKAINNILIMGSLRVINSFFSIYVYLSFI